jgi:hypothetical protein
MKIANCLTIASAALLFAGCAGPQMGTVIPRPDNVYEAIGNGKTSQESLESALFTAGETCKARQLRHIVTTEKTQYKGTMISERTNAVLSSPWLLGSSFASDTDYPTALAFKCEA